MKYFAEVIVKLEIEAKNKDVAEQLVNEKILFLDVGGAGNRGFYNIKTLGEQKLISLVELVKN